MNITKIEVIGSGCKKCKALFELTKEIAKKLEINTEVEYSTDVSKIAQMGVMSSPVLAVNDKPVLVGILPEKDKLKSILADQKHSNEKDSESSESKRSCCSCGGNC